MTAPGSLSDIKPGVCPCCGAREKACRTLGVSCRSCAVRPCPHVTYGGPGLRCPGPGPGHEVSVTYPRAGGQAEMDL